MSKYVIFDIDGTLNQTDLYAVEAYMKALQKRNIQATRRDIIECIGLSPASIIERLLGPLDEEEIQLWTYDIKKFEFELMTEKAKSFEGVEEMLSALKALGYKLAICSNAFFDHIEQVLSVIGIRSFFDEIGSLEWGNNKEEVLQYLMEKIEFEQACMVGDRMFDIQAARENGLPVIGCAYGYAPEEIQEADIVVKAPGEIVQAVKVLI
ncbi:MAG: HAD family hydrolase [Eubacteriales bacterium]|nr:HAD family hydrolase [Eubacteriales bacterium]